MHGTLLTCGGCCPQCPKTGHGGSDLHGARRVVAAAAAAAAAAPPPVAAALAPAAPAAAPAVPPAVPPAASTAAPPAAVAGRVQAPAPRSRSPRVLRMTAAELEERMRRQHRFFEGRFQWPLEPTWKYGVKASTWGQAVHLPLTTWWLRLLQAGTLVSVKLQIFLRWVQQQRREQAQAESKQQQELERGSSSSGSSSSGDFRMPPCVACLDRLPTQLCNPCGHLCLCEDCSLRLLQEEEPGCPVCRGPVESFTKVFY